MRTNEARRGSGRSRLSATRRIRNRPEVRDASRSRLLCAQDVGSLWFAERANQHQQAPRCALLDKSRGLEHEGIPLLVSPPVRVVPGTLIGRRKPNGVWPDPAHGLPPRLYLEIKSIRRVADDIQKRLYELAEASLEMKLLYGSVKLNGLNIKNIVDAIIRSTGTDASRSVPFRGRARRCPGTVVPRGGCAPREHDEPSDRRNQYRRSNDASAIRAPRLPGMT